MCRRPAETPLRRLACCGRMAHEGCLLERMRACIECAVPAFRCAGCAETIISTGCSWQAAFETRKRTAEEQEDDDRPGKRQGGRASAAS